MSKKVFFIDDDEFILSIVQTTLEAEGYLVETLSSTFGATRKILDSKPDLMLIDVKMPGLSGDGLVGILKKFCSPNNIPIVFYSSMDKASLTELVSRHNVLGYIQKGISIPEFIESIKKFLEISTKK